MTVREPFKPVCDERLSPIRIPGYGVVFILETASRDAAGKLRLGRAPTPVLCRVVRMRKRPAFAHGQLVPARAD